MLERKLLDIQNSYIRKNEEILGIEELKKLPFRQKSDTHKTHYNPSNKQYVNIYLVSILLKILLLICIQHFYFTLYHGRKVQF